MTDPRARTWSIAEVARSSGLTSRTLRHYDAIGLVRPVSIGPGGVRQYGEAELRRLQQVLILRELGVGLRDIATALDTEDGRSEAETLRAHLDRLRAERIRLARLAATVERTVDALEGGDVMDPAELFDGFDATRQAAYEEELVDRYGEDVRPVIDASNARVRRMSRDDARVVQDAFASIDRRMAQLMADGARPDDPRVFDVLDDHRAVVVRFWTPDRESYAGLGALYVDSPDFRARYESVRPGLAEFYRDAMAAYSEARL